LSSPTSKTVNINDAKTRLSELVELASRGEDVVITRDGRPVVQIVAFRSKRAPRRPGRMRGAIRVGRDFDAPLPEDLFNPSTSSERQ
jgi:prevent-host-death family protein